MCGPEVEKDTKLQRLFHGAAGKSKSVLKEFFGGEMIVREGYLYPMVNAEALDA